MKYSISEFVITVICFLRTQLQYPKQRLIRFPFYIRGKRGVLFGKGLTTGYGCRIDCSKKKESLVFGNEISLGDRVHIVAMEKVVIGDNCLFASHIFVSDCDHGDYKLSSKDILAHPKDRSLICQKVLIGHDCWIGENVCILKGSTIGNHCIIGANSVVNSIIPDYCIAVGQPAHVIRQFDIDKMIWKEYECER